MYSCYCPTLFSDVYLYTHTILYSPSCPRHDFFSRRRFLHRPAVTQRIFNNVLSLYIHLYRHIYSPARFFSLRAFSPSPGGYASCYSLHAGLKSDRYGPLRPLAPLQSRPNRSLYKVQSSDMSSGLTRNKMLNNDTTTKLLYNKTSTRV